MLDGWWCIVGRCCCCCSREPSLQSWLVEGIPVVFGNNAGPFWPYFSIDFEENGPNESPVVLNEQRHDVFTYTKASRVTIIHEVYQLTDEAD
jgi:hypothetical protein